MLFLLLRMQLKKFKNEKYTKNILVFYITYNLKCDYCAISQIINYFS
jgi:hypothetical protein